MIISFGEWAPDLPALGNSVTTAKNVIPFGKGYKKFPALAAYSSAISAYCRGAFATTDASGTVYGFAGDASTLYQLSGTTYSNVSKSGGYSCATDSYWEFVKWGNKCIATNWDDNIQIMTLGGASFADLSGSPPKARHIGIVRDFVVVGNTYDGSDGNVPHRVRWSGLDNETTWTVSATTQADFQDLQGNGGFVQAIMGGQERGIIFQERAIWMMSYIGSPVVFQFDQVENARGAIAPRSVIDVGNRIFYLADDGFYQFSGGSSIPIGHNKIDKYFFNDLDDAYVDRICSAADPLNKIVVWAYPSAGNVGGNPNKLLIYSWADNKWAIVEQDVEFIFSSMSTGYTLDQLDTISTDLDALGVSLDSRLWAGGSLRFSAFDDTHKLAHFTGSAMSGVIETGETDFGGVSSVNEVRALVDGGTHTVQVGTRMKQADSVTWGSEAVEDDSGICPVRATSRYHRYRVNTSGDFTDAMGVEVEPKRSGKR